MKPIEFHDFVDSAEARRESWRRKIVIDRDINQASPNCGHRAVAALVRLGLCQTVITENIDGLHQVSDPSDDNVVELHGNGTYASCLTCGRRHELEPIYIAFARDESLPVCDHK
jgi:NAD-dependent deacetylase